MGGSHTSGCARCLTLDSFIIQLPAMEATQQSGWVWSPRLAATS